jgi:hypothetical protein
VAGLDGGDAQRDQRVALAGAGRPDQTQILVGTDPLQAGQVVEGRAGDRGGGDVELLQGLGDGEGGGLEPVAGVRGVAGADLGLDQGAQQLLWRPALGLGGDQQLGGEGAHRGQLEPPQPGGQVRRQRRSGSGHRAPAQELPMA